MEKKQIIDSKLLDIILSRLCQEVVENHQNFEDTVLLGLQPRGIQLADRVQSRLLELTGQKVPLGYLDVTFYRDDFRRRDTPLQANKTQIDFALENKKVILIDDVLYTGRTVRSALDAMLAFGRPKKVELLILINRRYTRHLPVAPDYWGQEVNTLTSQHVEVEWHEKTGKPDVIWLLEDELA